MAHITGRDTPWQWLAVGDEDRPHGTGWLAPGEAARMAGLRYPKRRAEYLLRRLVAKRAVAAVAGLPVHAAALSRIEVGNAPGGVPVVRIDGRPAEYGISLTDRGGWAVCLVGSDAGTGVACDLELVEPRSEAFVRDFLTRAERRFVGSQPSADARHAAANLVWSAKESALKLVGTGLRRDTRTVEVSLGCVAAGEGWHPFAARIDGYGTAPGWWRRDGGFVLTVLAVSTRPPPVALGDARVLASALPREPWLSRPRREPSPAPARRPGTAGAGARG